MNMVLISTFMTGGTKMPYKLKKNPAGLCVYNILLPSGEKLLKCKTVHKINGLIGNIQYFSGTEPSTCQNVF